MKFKEPRIGPGDGYRPGAGVHARPSWVQEWIANKGKYVRLKCGCRVDLNDRTVLTTITHVDGLRQVWCYFHEEVYEIDKSIGLYEFHYGFAPEPLPDIPPY